MGWLPESDTAGLPEQTLQCFTYVISEQEVCWTEKKMLQKGKKKKKTN